ncbi:MAG: dTDP-4-dehydrorhamnose 3,5-epimerase [Clostridiales bacterium]|nr:dTDP-4-dehydrorhamnose 3,5-epimerase [Clostridiales bacterium]
MRAIKTKIPEVLIIEPDCYGDHRGWFMETYSEPKFKELGITAHFVQDNHSMSAKKGTVRAIHFQNNPMAQAKLVRCTNGAVIDVAVDLRKGSPTYKQWVSVEISAENKRQVYVPRGFGHGFIALTDNVEFVYKVDNVYSKEHDRGIRFDDPSIGVDWGGLLDGIEPILSEKDRNAPLLENSDCNFIYEV